MKKGDRVTITGHGRTAKWTDRPQYLGTVTKRRGTRVFVHWDNTRFEDEMDIKEVKILGEE